MLEKNIFILKLWKQQIFIEIFIGISRLYLSVDQRDTDPVVVEQQTALGSVVIEFL